ncbi:unnamed protein product, partial [Bubo scandiacus]
MGSTLSKEEAAVVKLLQHILSKRGVSYDEGNLRKLLLRARQHELIPSATAAFELATWEKIGVALWDDLSSGSKDSRKLSTVWRLVLDTLKEMKAERQTTASAFAALSAEAESASAKDSATAMTFAGSLFPKAAPKRRDGDASHAAPVRQENQEQKSTGLLQLDSPPSSPKDQSPEATAPPRSRHPPPATVSSLEDGADPALPPSSPPTPRSVQEQSRYDLQDQHLQELTRKLEQLEIQMQQAAQPIPMAPLPPPLPINRFFCDTGGG